MKSISFVCNISPEEVHTAPSADTHCEVQICALGSQAESLIDQIRNSEFTHELIKRDDGFSLSNHSVIDPVVRIVIADHESIQHLRSDEKTDLESECCVRWAVIIGEHPADLNGYAVSHMPEVIPDFDMFIINFVKASIGRGAIGIDLEDVKTVTENKNCTCFTISDAGNKESLREKFITALPTHAVKVTGVFFVMNLSEESGTLMDMEMIRQEVETIMDSQMDPEANLLFACPLISDTLAKNAIPASGMICWEK